MKLNNIVIRLALIIIPLALLRLMYPCLKIWKRLEQP